MNRVEPTASTDDSNMKPAAVDVLSSFLFRVRRFGIELLDLVYSLTHPHATVSPLIVRKFYHLHWNDRVRIIGIDPDGREVPLQGFKQASMPPGLVVKCLETHRIEQPDLLVVVVDLRTGEVNFS